MVKFVGLFLLGTAVIAAITYFYLSGHNPKPTVTTPPITREFALESDTGTRGATSATILGSITINGYVPDGSTINVLARKPGDQQFSTVIQNLPGKSNQPFSYTTALAGNSYQIQGVFLDASGKVIAASKILTVPAPTLNALLTINSPAPTATPTATPMPTPATATQSGQIDVTPTPAPTPIPTPTLESAVISGNISFHGNAPINSRVVIFQKLANAAGYQVAQDNLTPIDGTLWQWTETVNGTSYNIVAILKQHTNGVDQDIASSPTITVTAPTANIILTINSAYTLTKPTGTISVNCLSYDSAPNQNIWTVTVGYPVITGAKSYWLQVGTSNGASDIVNTASSTNVVGAVFKNNTTYFARFAYAAVTGAQTGSDEFSAFSDTTQLQCSK